MDTDRNGALKVNTPTRKPGEEIDEAVFTQLTRVIPERVKPDSIKINSYSKPEAGEFYFLKVKGEYTVDDIQVEFEMKLTDKNVMPW